MDYIAFANFDGSNMRYIIKDKDDGHLAHIFAITVFEDSIYWTDWEHSSIRRAHKYTGMLSCLYRDINFKFKVTY